MKLYQIVELLSNQLDQRDVLFNDNCQLNLEGKLGEMYEGFKNGDFRNDEEAALSLFDKGPDYPYFFEVKAKFRDQLLKNLFHLNLRRGKFMQYYVQEIECDLAVQQARILLKMGQKFNAIWLLKRTIKIAESYEFTTILKECYRNLKNQMVYDGNVKKYEEYQQKWLLQKEIENAEDEAEDLINQMRVMSQKSVKGVKQSHRIGELAYKRVKELKEKYFTPKLLEKYYYIANAYFMRISDWEAKLELATELDENSKKYPDKYAAVRVKMNHISKLYALILLNRIEEGLDYIHEVLDEYRPDEINYFIILEDYYLLNMRAGNYEKALSIVDQVLESKYFERVPAISRERWYIYSEYALFYCNKDSDRNISLVNHFPEYSKDKIGFNLQILILQAMVLIRDGKHDLFFNHIEKLRIYEIRQISKSDNRRAQYFLRMLRQLAQYELKYDKCKKQGNKYYNLLKKFPEREQPYAEVEIVPYETLWKTILRMIKIPVSKRYEVYSEV